MNDFTKEELKRLLLRSFLWVGHIENQNKFELELINKIQSLIDNYCEHEPSDRYPNEFKWQLCCKCGADYK